MKKACEKWVTACLSCQQVKDPRKLRFPLQLIESSEFNEVVQIDHQKISMTDSGYNQVLVMIDHFTKYAEAVPCITASSVHVPNYCNVVLHSQLPIRAATYRRRTGNRTKKLRADLDTTMENMKNLMNELLKPKAGPSHGKIDKQTGVWKEVLNRKVKPLKDIIIEATEEQKREEAEENRRKKNMVVYKAKESAATDSIRNQKFQN